MTRTETKKPNPTRILPVYETPQPNAPIDLYSGPMKFNSERGEFDGEGSLRLEWLPSPAMRFRMRTPMSMLNGLKLTFEILSENDATLELKDIGQVVKVFNPSLRGHSEKEQQLTGYIFPPVSFGKESRLSSLLFHVPNFPEIAMSPDRFVQTDGIAAYGIERLRFEWDGWYVTIDLIPLGRDVRNEVRASRGYVVSGVGQVERVSGKTFALEKARPVLDVLQHLLSFALHRWCSPFLLVGYDKEGGVLCEQWSAPRISRYQSHMGWFDFHHPGALYQLFPVLCRRWQDEHWREAFKEAIYWYIEIHENPVQIESAIVLGQVTLEMLGWLRFVEESPTISEHAFKNLPAADKLKLLLTFSSIPIEAPAELKNIQKVSRSENWQGPDAVVEIRNSIVHRSRRKREQSAKKNLSGSDLLTEAYQLVCWYVELLLLRCLEYEGKYSNRLKARRVNEVEPVPWGGCSNARESDP